jgi:hypothetical protein
MLRERLKTFWLPLALSLIAPAVAIYLRWLMWAPPAHVLLYPDPDYGYLFNSLLLIDGQSPWHIDHPGTPIQLIGALVMKLRYLFTGTAPDLAADFFAHPIEYHQATMLTLFGIFLLCQWQAGFRLLRMGIPPVLAVTAALLPLTYFDLLDYFDHVSPECLLGGTAILLAPYLLLASSAENADKQKIPWRAVAAGALLALLCTLKATSIPLLLCLFLLPGRRAILGGAASFVFFYLGITAPIWTEFPRMLGWYQSLMAGQGMYGQGGGSLSLTQLTYNFHWLFGGGQWNGIVPAFLLFLPLMAWPSTFRRWPVLLAAAVLFALILKHPGTRYVLPFITLFSLALLRTARAPVFVHVVLAGLLLSLAPGALRSQVEGITGWRMQEALSAITLEQKLNEPPLRECNVTAVNELAHFSYALFAGNFATAIGNYGAQLHLAHPRYNFIFTQVRSFEATLTAADWAAFVKSAPCHLFIGRPGRTPATIEEVFHVKPELVALIGPGENSAIYRVKRMDSLVLRNQPKFVPAETPNSLRPLVSPLKPPLP